MKCDRCGANLALVGRIHRCVANNMANSMANDAPMANSMANTDGVSSSGSTYRYRDEDARRAYQRDYMRRKRMEAKNAGA